MIIVITQGVRGVQNWAKVDYVICARSLMSTLKQFLMSTSECISYLVDTMFERFDIYLKKN